MNKNIELKIHQNVTWHNTMIFNEILMCFIRCQKLVAFTGFESIRASWSLDHMQ